MCMYFYQSKIISVDVFTQIDNKRNKMFDSTTKTCMLVNGKRRRTCVRHLKPKNYGFSSAGGETRLSQPTSITLIFESNCLTHKKTIFFSLFFN